MKKKLIFMLALLMALSLAGCKSEQKEEPEESASAAPTEVVMPEDADVIRAPKMSAQPTATEKPAVKELFGYLSEPKDKILMAVDGMRSVNSTDYTNNYVEVSLGENDTVDYIALVKPTEGYTLEGISCGMDYEEALSRIPAGYEEVYFEDEGAKRFINETTNVTLMLYETDGKVSNIYVSNYIG